MVTYTFRSVLEITREWKDFEVNERRLTMKEVLQGVSNGTLIEMFGTGTAAIVSPVANIYFEGKMRQLPLPESNVSLSNRYSYVNTKYRKVANTRRISICL